VAQTTQNEERLNLEKEIWFYGQEYKLHQKPGSAGIDSTWTSNTFFS
jgi:hypothetical protein